MNKETRSFIWGLLLIIVCGSSLGTILERVAYGDAAFLDGLGTIFALLGVYLGAKRVYKNID